MHEFFRYGAIIVAMIIMFGVGLRMFTPRATFVFSLLLMAFCVGFANGQ